ncbi:MAG: hypothetical protein RBU36_15920 [Thermoanaerobaculia bacterium]|jgi:hypothetical protein|nr:hypothetical protein [Thermoanaerobaculia bacterium]
MAIRTKKPEDVGPEAVEELFDLMKIDEEWSVRRPQGYSWWGHRHRQDVSAGPEVRSEGIVICRLQARTAMVRDVPLSDRLELLVATLNAHAALNAIVLDRAARRVFLSSHFVLHRGTLDWGLSLFASAVATQAVEAVLLAGLYSSMGFGELDETPHPLSGARPEPDEMLSVVEQVYAPVGRQPSRFPASEFEKIGRSRKGPSVLTSASGAALTAEFPFTGSTSSALRFASRQAGEDPGGPETAPFQATAEAEHPRYGSGCLLLLRLPRGGITPEVVNRLNLAEANGQFFGYGLGAWCVSDETAVHACFLPSAAYRPGLLEAMMLDRAGRTLWARGRLLGPEQGTGPQ